MIRNSAAAGPAGLRRSCSQFCSVFTLTPVKRANSDWDSPVRSRIARTLEEPTKNRREGFFPRRIAPPSRTLLKSSSNIFVFIAEFLLDRLGQLRDLFRREIRRRALG